MSSDLLEDLEDEKGVSISFAMAVSGVAYLNLTDKEDPLGIPGCSLNFRLAPNKQGLEAAETLEKALSAWREQVTKVGLADPQRGQVGGAL
jgi:hypothetical protein